MRARILGTVTVIVMGLGCGPNVESTSDTLDTGNGDTPTDTEDGDDSCDGETPPPVLAYFDAFDRLDLAFADLAADVEAVRTDMADALGLPPDASIEAVAAELEAIYAANVGPGSALRIDAHRCSGGLAASRENLALCEPGLVVSDVAFACDGECTVAAAADCPSPRCRGTASSCAGACTGVCEPEVSTICDGICTGICDGECSCVDDVGDCVGPCSGACTGTCTAVDVACAGDCDGTCVGTDIATCEGTLWCDTPGFACTVDCSGWAVAIDLESGCEAIASAAGAASQSCAPPFASLVVASATCSTFAAMVPTLEDAAARLRRDLDRFDTIIDRTAPALTPYIAALIESVDLPPCVVMLVIENITAYETSVNAAAQVRLDAQRLFDALDP